MTGAVGPSHVLGETDPGSSTTLTPIPPPKIEFSSLEIE